MPASSSFTQKQLRATLTLPAGNQSFASGGNTLKLTGFRMSATITGSANWTNFLDLMIYGMQQKDMNAVTVVWAGPSANSIYPKATIVLEANDGSGWIQIFQGSFLEAAPDYHSLPDVGLSLYATTTNGPQVESAPPTSYQGSTDAAVICQTLAKSMGFTFENNLTAPALINTPYLYGTLMDQFRQTCDAANIDYYFDSAGALIITPKNSQRSGKQTVNLSPTTGLIGYPTIQRFGVSVLALWRPALALGSPITIKDSDVPGANGNWFPYKLVHQLESEKPGGQWFTSMDCSPSNPVAAS